MTQPTPDDQPSAQPPAQQPELPDEVVQAVRPDGGASAEEAPPPTGPDAAAPEEGDVGAADIGQQLEERTRDLQRLQAEYVNYKRRVDRDRGVVRDTVTAGVLTALLPVLDDLDRARQHGELVGGFKAVADSLERTLTALGLIRFGEPGEPFDPQVHEALTHGLSDEVSGPTAQDILQPGYRIGDRVVRPARVAVVEPSTDAGGDDAAGGPGQVTDAGASHGSDETG